MQAYRKHTGWLLVLPVLWGLGLVFFFGVNLVYKDDWRIVEMLKQFRDFGFDPRALFSLHNEHRIALPRIALMLSGLWTDYNTRVQMFLSQAVVLAVYGIYLAYIRTIDSARRQPGAAPGNWALGVSLLAGLACYHSKQYENFLWAFQIGFLLVSMFAVLSFYFFAKALDGGPRANFVAAILCGIAAELSCLQGLFVFPIFAALQIWLWAVERKSPGRRLGWVLACAALSWIAYFVHFQKPPGHSTYAAGSVASAVAYFFASAGSIAAARQAAPAVVLGGILWAVIVALIVHLVRHRRTRESLFPLGMILFSAAVSASLAVGRSGAELGVAGAMTSRYATFSLMGFIGILLVVYREYPDPAAAAAGGRRMWRACACFLGLLGLCLLGTNFLYIIPCRKWRAERLEDVRAMQNCRTVEWVDLKRLGPFADREDAWRFIDIAKDYEWNVFSK